MMQRLTMAAEILQFAAPVRVVVVTMDSHLSGAVARAETALKRELPGLSLVVHAADEWGTDQHALAECLQDIGTGDVVIATMLFLEDHIRPVQAALAARRENCDAMLCCMSANEITRLTKLGRFDMMEEATGALAMLKKLRGAKKGEGKTNGVGSDGKSQMKMLRRLPKLMRFIPGTAQDVRTYFLALQYWLAGSDENLSNLVRMLVSRYSGHNTIKVAAPVNYPDVGLYHPSLPGRITESLDLLVPPAPVMAPRRMFSLVGQSPAPAAAETHKGTVGILLLRSYLISGNAAHYDGVIAALEARGLRVIPAFASGLDSRPAIEAYFMRDGRATVDTVLSLTGFSLVGGPAYNDSRAAEALLAQLDVPYVSATPVEFQTLEQWEGDARGLLPVEATMMVAIPELDGAINPMVFGGRSTSSDATKRDMAAHPERAAALANRVTKLVALRRSQRAERKVAIVLFNFPPNAGATGTAAYLAVFKSLFNTLTAMKTAGYDVEIPADVDTLRSLVVDGGTAYGQDGSIAARVNIDDHVRRQPWLSEIESTWGPAPGKHNTDGASLFVLGRQFGNVFVGLQPAFGFEGDPMRLLFERGFAPTHAFCAFYRWITEDFRADAVLHFGTHGALEFMPGKQTGLSAACWPDRLIGALPNVNLYASNNPSEGMIAKRRAAATLISYLTPPVAHAGLYRGLLDLKSSIDRWRTMEPDTDAEQRDALATLIQAQAENVNLSTAGGVDRTAVASGINRIAADLLELEYTLIPHGLHVIGEPPTAEERAATLDAAGITDPVERARLDALLAEDHELPAVIHALDGGYVRPAPGGDILRTTDVLPTGRNLHGFDPFRIPSQFATGDGARQADRLLARHMADGAGLPETIAMVLWGTDNLKSEGGPIAQALWLMGAAPRFDSYGRLCGAKLIPLAELGRARVDVVITLSGIFRDLLPLQTKLLAEAALLAAQADETPAEKLHPQARFGVHGGPGRHPRTGRPPRLRQRRRRLRCQRQPDGRLRRLERRRRTRRRLHHPQGLRLRRRRPRVVAKGRPPTRSLQRRSHLPEPRQHRAWRHHRRPLLRHPRRRLPRRPPGPRRRRRPGLYRRSNPRRRHRPHPQRAGHAGDPHPRPEPEMVRSPAQTRLRRRPRDRRPRHQHPRLVGDHRRSQPLGLPATRRDLRARRRHARAPSPTQSKGVGQDRRPPYRGARAPLLDTRRRDRRSTPSRQ